MKMNFCIALMLVHLDKVKKNFFNNQRIFHMSYKEYFSVQCRPRKGGCTTNALSGAD
jgi:hypothetical protein